ncbi:ricin-type beta-trefoil lectin domain protein [Streptomyces sp. NPDC056165]|uniref:ricin-type beta-trefoil lectin domain protein n=1 Tax=Streptomyces sp. NPDC056165 TaxID=3345733 RepID=UPI0035E0B4D1
MARADGTDDGGVETGDTGGGPHEDASDTRLIELLRADTPTVYPALRELRQLAAQAFTLAARETARGADPGVPVRLRLLLLTARLTAAWARDERSGGVDPGLLLVLNTAGPEGPVPPLLSAFRSLPTRVQGLVWYGIAEQEPEERTARFLGLTRQDVVHGTPQALKALAQACLRTRLAASDDPRCGDFRRLIEEAVRPDHPRASLDLHDHMARCGHCWAAFEEQSALRDHPRTAVAEGLLPWGGAAYVARRPADPPPGARARAAAWPPSRRYALASAALGVALAPLLLFLLASNDGTPHQRAAGAVTVPTPPVRVTVTATVSATPSAPSPSATSRPPSRHPSPEPTPGRSRTARPKPPPSPSPSPVRPPGASYAQVVNAASGRCLDVVGDFDNGTDVATAPCGSASSQRWRFDASRQVLQSAADPDFCLDSRGSVENGVGIWRCSSADGRNGRNLRFTVDPDGVIRPAIATGTALTPHPDGYLSLDPRGGGMAQKWRAGSA